MIYAFKGCRPVVHEKSFVHPQATVIGSVAIGAQVYIGPQCVLRGDFGHIKIDKGANVQECCVVHSFPNVMTHIAENAHIGHGAIIHGATIEENALVGMNAVIMDNAIIGRESIIGALAFVKTDMNIPPRSLVVGNPAKIIKEVSDEMIAWKTKGTEIYQQLSQDALTELIECEPLRSMDDQSPIPKVDFDNWKKTQEKI